MPVVITEQTRHGHDRPRDFSQNPMIVYWEMTQACGLACRHCRAEAVLQRHPNELNYAGSRALLQQIVAFGEPLPHLILTGGDPLMRPDLYELIDEATALGMEVSITPAATPNLTRDVVANADRADKDHALFKVLAHLVARQSADGDGRAHSTQA